MGWKHRQVYFNDYGEVEKFNNEIAKKSAKNVKDKKIMVYFKPDDGNLRLSETDFYNPPPNPANGGKLKKRARKTKRAKKSHRRRRSCKR